MAQRAQDDVAVAPSIGDGVIALRLLHTPLLWVGSRSHALPPKDAALLAILALDGPSKRTKLALMLWPDAGNEGAHNNLRQRLFRLRKLAGCDVVLQGPTLVLASGVAHDLGLPQPALESDAAALPGELLGAHEYDDTVELAQWVESAREHWRAARRDGLAAIAARLEGANQIAAALAYADRLARDEPLLEHAQRRLMQLHYRRGDRGAALEVYERLKAALDEQLGETPSRETQQIVALIEAAIELPVAPPPQQMLVMRPPRLIGREREWAVLRAAWAERRMVVVRGEPGIGKSRLLQDFMQSQGASVLVQGRPGDASVAYSSLARLLRALWSDDAAASATLEPWVRMELARVVPELGDAAEGNLQPLRLRAAVERAIDQCAPAALAVDDLQFADAATLEMLPALAAATQAPRWLYSVREAEVPASVQGWLDGMDSSAWQPLDLQVLDEGGVHELLRSLEIPGFDASKWAARVHRHTGGNPMFILETMLAVLRDPDRSAAAENKDTLPVPSNLGELFAHRLDLLSPGALKLARVAAVAAQDFSLDLAAAVMEISPLDLADPWQELIDGHVLLDQAFAHDLIFEAVLRSLPAPIARWLHGAVAAYGADHEAPKARVAAHWEAAGDLNRAAQAYHDAATAADDAGRMVEMITLFERAADLFEVVGDDRAAFESLRWLVVARLQCMPGISPTELHERMARLAADDYERGESYRMQAITCMTASDFDGVIDAGDRALECFARCSDNDDAIAAGFMLAHTRATALARAGRSTEALAAIDSASTALEGVVALHTNLRSNALAERANVFMACDRRAAAMIEFEAAVAQARADGHLQHEHIILGVGAGVQLQLGCSAEAHRLATQAVALHDRFGVAQGVALRLVTMLGWSSRDLGRHAQALQCLEDAHRGLLPTAMAAARAEAEHQLSLTWMFLGRMDRMEQVLTPLPDHAPRFVHLSRVLHRAWIAAAQGRGIGAFDAGLADLLACPSSRSYERLMVALLQSRALKGEDAASRAMAIARQAESLELPSIQVLALVRAADAGESTELAAQALEMLDIVQPLMSYAPGLRWRMLRLCLAAGDETRTDELIALAAAIEETCRTQVPEPFRDSFLQRNAANRDILAAAARLRANPMGSLRR